MAEGPSVRETAAQLASIKGGSTASILIRLYKAHMHVPASVPDTDPDLRRMVRYDAESAQMRKDVVMEFSSRLSQTIGAIDASLDQLQKSKATAPLHAGYFQKLTPLKVDAAAIIKERENFVREIGEYIQHQHGAMPTVIQDMFEANKPKVQIKAVFDDVFSKRPDLNARAIKLDINEKSLQQKLDQLHLETFNAVPAADRAHIAPPISIATEEKTTKRLG